MTNRCLFCGENADEPDHLAHCDGRQGRIADDAPRVPETKRDRYRRLLRVYQDTSREAWEVFQEHASAVDARILQALGAGRSCEDVEQMTGLKHQTVSAQIRHMAEAGLLVDSGTRAVTASGRRAIVWRVVARL